MDLVSVITPAYNAAKYIGETIESIINQTYTNWELVIVNDGSTDNTVEVISQYVKHYPDKIKLVDRRQNHGTAYTINEAMNNAKGKYMCWLSADDLYNPMMIESSLEQLMVKGTDFVFSRCDYIDDNSQFLYDDPRKTFWGKTIHEKGQPYRYFITKGCCLHGCTVFGYREKFLGVDGFDSQYRYAHDYDYWLRLLAKYTISGFDKVNVRGREYPSQISKQGNNEVDAIKVLWGLINNRGDFEKLAEKSGFSSPKEAIISAFYERIRYYATEDKELEYLKDSLIDKANRNTLREVFFVSDNEIDELVAKMDFFLNGCKVEPSFFEESYYLSKIVEKHNADAILLNKKAIRFNQYESLKSRERFVKGLERNNNIWYALVSKDELEELFDSYGEETVYYMRTQPNNPIKLLVSEFMVMDDKTYTKIGNERFKNSNRTYWDDLLDVSEYSQARC